MPKRWALAAAAWAVCLAVLFALVGCSSQTQRLQTAVDNANRLSLRSGNSRTYLMMFWDDRPQEWLMVNDSLTVDGSVLYYGAYVSFSSGQLDSNSRLWILENQEIQPPGMLGLILAEPLKQKQDYYESSAREVSRGRKWSGRSLTTTIHPRAVPYRELGIIDWEGGQVRLLTGDVQADRERDTHALYPHVRTVVGLEAGSGELVFEYIANLEPWTREGHANRMLTLYDRSDWMVLHGSFGEAPPEERSRLYLELRDRMTTLELLLNRKSAIDQATSAAAS